MKNIKCPKCQTILKEIGKDYNTNLRFMYCPKCGCAEWKDIKNGK